MLVLEALTFKLGQTFKFLAFTYRGQDKIFTLQIDKYFFVLEQMLKRRVI